MYAGMHAFERERKREKERCSEYNTFLGGVYMYDVRRFVYDIYIYGTSYLNKKKIFNESTYAYTHTQNKTILCFTHYDSKVRKTYKRKYARVCAKLYRIFY